MGNFLVRYDSRVVIYERKMFIRLATDEHIGQHIMQHERPKEPRNGLILPHRSMKVF